MAKVKKRTAVTGVRNVKAGKGPKKVPARKKAVDRKRKTKGRTRPVPARPASKGKPAATASAKSPPGRVAVRELDPQRKCGEGTSVQFLYRVDETVDGRATAHLVFFDRHGWYCEHGRTCPAVAHARKHNGHIARAS